MLFLCVVEVQLVLTELDCHKFRIFQCNFHVNHKKYIKNIQRRQGKANPNNSLQKKKINMKEVGDRGGK